MFVVSEVCCPYLRSKPGTAKRERKKFKLKTHAKEKTNSPHDIRKKKSRG